MSYRCNFCGGVEHRPLYENRDWVACTNCGLVSLLAMPGVDDVRELYDKEYSDGESFNQFYAGLSVTRKAEAALRLRWLERFAPGRKLLDVGSGMGYFVEAAVEHGWDAAGVEISQRAVELQRGRNLTIFNCPYEAFEPDELYDVITLWATLEHVLDPRRMLAKTYELLKPGGVAVIETGDISSRNAQRDGVNWRMFYIAGHLYFFGSDSLDRVLEAIGFRVLDTRLDKWIEHALMQNEAQYSILTANRLLPPIVVRAASYLKYRINQLMGTLGWGDVMIKVVQKPQS